jgi:glycine amidinotransferase
MRVPVSCVPGRAGYNNFQFTAAVRAADGQECGEPPDAGKTVMSEPHAACPVNSHTEWDPLEEVIVGRLDGATLPPDHVAVTFNASCCLLSRLYRLVAGRRYPSWMVRRANKELEEFIHILEAEGVVVRRPDAMDFHTRFRTPHWSSRGFVAACPRDVFLVVGNEIVETPSCWRSRFFEAFAYRTLFKEYFAKGAKWSAAPRPELTERLFDPKFRPPKTGEPIRYVINEFEPVFDAADFVRCGKDLFVTRSNVTNCLGIEWLRRHLGGGYRIHEIESRCRQPMHIDTTLLPLAPGKVLVNPEYLDVGRLPPVLKSWDILPAPEPDPVDGIMARLSACSRWLSMNVLMLDENRVMVDRSQPSLVKALKGWGFDPIPCAFLSYGPFGGSFHCATLDIRRRGTLTSYF